MFRPLQGHYQGGIYKGIQVQQILSVPSTCFDLYKVIIREVYTKAYKYSKFCQSSPYMFRPLQGHHQGGIYKDIQVQQILSKFPLHVSTSTRSSSERYIHRHTSTANSVKVPPTCFDHYKIIIREVYTKKYKYNKFCHRCACVELKYNTVNQNY
jgi:hypothetical protein